LSHEGHEAFGAVSNASISDVSAPPAAVTSSYRLTDPRAPLKSTILGHEVGKRGVGK